MSNDGAIFRQARIKWTAKAIVMSNDGAIFRQARVLVILNTIMPFYG
jgi:hypothetical protein